MSSIPLLAKKFSAYNNYVAVLQKAKTYRARMFKVPKKPRKFGAKKQQNNWILFFQNHIAEFRINSNFS